MLKGNGKLIHLYMVDGKRLWTSVFSECSVILQWMFSKMNWISSLHNYLCTKSNFDVLKVIGRLAHSIKILKCVHWIWIIQTFPNIVMTSSLIRLKYPLLLLCYCMFLVPNTVLTSWKMIFKTTNLNFLNLNPVNDWLSSYY